MHEVLVNPLGGLCLPRKNVVRLTDCPNMTSAVYRGRKTTTQQQHFCLSSQWCGQLKEMISLGVNHFFKSSIVLKTEANRKSQKVFPIIKLAKTTWRCSHLPKYQIVLTLLILLFLARLFSKKTSRYCHSPGVVVGGDGVQKL